MFTPTWFQERYGQRPGLAEFTRSKRSWRLLGACYALPLEALEVTYNLEVFKRQDPMRRAQEPM